MNRVKLTFALFTLALATLSAASHYSLTLDSAQWAGDKQLKPGEYRIEVSGDKATLKSGKTVVELPITVETGQKKYSVTSYNAVDSKIVEIQLGGTNKKLVFGSAATQTK